LEYFFSTPIAIRISLSLRGMSGWVASVNALRPAACVSLSEESTMFWAFCTRTLRTYCMVMVEAPDCTSSLSTFCASARAADSTSTPPCS
jgi:hypothetical protein